MARFDIDEHFLTGDIYEVSKDDWSKRRRFTDRVEAEAYYEMLKREEVQDSIARNQATTVEQNKEIIANQQRLIEEQQRNNRMQQRPPFPQPTRQILDPAYKEWLEFQRETNPAFLKWKKEKEARKAAELVRLQKERDIKELGMDEGRILKLATAFNNGVCSVKTNRGIAWKIVKLRIYTFSNVSVIQDLLDIIDSQENFQIFWEQYKSYTDIIIKSASLRFADRQIISQLLEKYWQEESSVDLIKKNACSEDSSCVGYIDCYIDLIKKRPH